MNTNITEQRFWIGSLLMLCAGLYLSGCQTARMALPQELQTDSKMLTVEGRSLSEIRKTFNFASYRVIELNRGLTKGKGLSISSGETEFSISKARQKYDFSIHESGRTSWKVQCAAGANWNQLEMEGFLGGRFGIEFTPNKQLICTLNQEIGVSPSKLIMGLSASTKATSLRGIMMNGTTQIDISATHKLDSSPLQVGGPTGYIFQIGGRPVGAVEVINKGTVWLRKSEPPKIHSVLAATSAVLLLYQDVQENLQGP